MKLGFQSGRRISLNEKNKKFVFQELWGRIEGVLIGLNDGLVAACVWCPNTL